MLEILQEWLNTYEEGKPHLRLGQSLMNAIYFNSDLGVYNYLAGTELDCFYNDEIIPRTLLKLQELINVRND